MSGGSYDYICYKMEDAAKQLLIKEQPNYRRAFGQLMMCCAKAMHDVEWVDSCDMGRGDDQESIMQCILKQDVLAFTIEEAKSTIKELQILIEECEKKQ